MLRNLTRLSVLLLIFGLTLLAVQNNAAGIIGLVLLLLGLLGLTILGLAKLV